MTQAPTIAEEQRLIADDFELFDDWREKIEYVLDLGRRLPAFPEQHRIDANKVKGCQSQVWMVAELDQASNRMRIAADSDAFIVRGLIALLLRLYANRPPKRSWTIRRRCSRRSGSAPTCRRPGRTACMR